MQVQQTATRTPQKIEGAKVGLSKAISPVVVTRLRAVGKDRQIIEAQLEQMFEPPVGNLNGVIGITMAGHSAFSSGPRKKVSWINFYTPNLIKWGYISKWEDVGESTVDTTAPDGTPITMQGTLLINQELVIRDSNGSPIPLKLVEIDSYEPRRWVDAKGNPREQAPKQAGAGGDLLLRDGKKVYRNTSLSMPGTDDSLNDRPWDYDLVIVHNNQITSSAVRNAMNKSGIGMPQIPGQEQGAPSRNPSLVNAGIGQTGNLVNPQPEPTRHIPDGNTEVADETLAQDAREAGTRAVVTQ